MADKKFSPMRYTASTEEAAIVGALQIVGAAREDVEVEIIEASAKGVTVRVKPRSQTAPVQDAPVIAAPEPEIEPPSTPIAEDVPELLAQSEENSETEAEESEPESEIEAQIGDELDSYAADFSEETPEFDDETPQIEAEAPVAEPQIEAAPIEPLDPAVVSRAQNKAQEFLDKMGLEASAQIDKPTSQNTVALVIEGADVGILIGKHGATLQSFQYLLNLTLNAHLEGETARSEGVRVVVDAGNYRARRQSSLEQIARSAAAKARRDGRMVRLEPMPAHERRLVHMFLQVEIDIVTQSEGREPMRRIVVSPASTSNSVEAPIRTPPAERSERPFNGRGGGNQSGMGSYGRRGDANSERQGRGFGRNR